MSIEREIMKRITFDFEKLKTYGFIQKGKTYQYSKTFMEGLRADIIIDENQEVTGKVYDTNFEEEYNNFRMENQTGEFANTVKEAYQNILKDIANKCGEKKNFITNQANRITKFIFSFYHDEPEFPWESSSGFGIFRNPTSKKWYGLIMNIDKNKLDKKSSGEVEAINVKLDNQRIENLLNKQGFYPAYHMNKKHWISIILDDTLTDEEVIECIKESHTFTEKSHHLTKENK